LVEEEEEREWGRLMPVTAAHVVHRLVPRGDLKKGSGDADVHTVGRNSKCDVVVADMRVSGYHCRIYRRYDAVKRFVAYVEDTSSNGTFVNRVKLQKRERRELASGDEVRLVSPTKDKEGSTSFTFISLAEQQHQQETTTSLQRLQKTRPSDEVTLREIRKVAGGTLGGGLDADYAMREELGSGSIGKVFKAIARDTGDPWAVKVINLRHFSSNLGSLTADDILHESRVLREISHPAVVSVRGVYVTDYELNIVMQLVEGGDLFDRLVQLTSFSEDDARGMMTNLLSALAYLHDRGIAHRDVKPENILLRTKDDNTDVLLTDFGLAKFTAVGPQACQTFCGTPQYLAPEVLAKQPDGADAANLSDDTLRYDGAAADTWSAGVVLYVCLSGTQPTKAHWLFLDPCWDAVSLDAKAVIRLMTIIAVHHRPAIAQVQSLPWFHPSESEGGDGTAEKKDDDDDHASSKKRDSDQEEKHPESDGSEISRATKRPKKKLEGSL